MLFNPYYLLFLPAISGVVNIPGLPPSVNRKLMADFRHSSVNALTRARPVRLMPKSQNPRKVPFIVGVWEFADCTRARCAQHKPPLPIKNR